MRVPEFRCRREVSALHVVEQAPGVPMKRFERPMLAASAARRCWP
jgi:hypothetical protein